MKKKITYFNCSIISLGVFFLLSGKLHGQTNEDIPKLKKQTNNLALKGLLSSYANQVNVESQLKQKAKERGIPYYSTDENGTTSLLVGFEGNNNPIYLLTDNQKSAITSQVNLIQSGIYNLSGQNVKVLEWDGGRIRKTHVEFSGRVTDGADTGTIATDLSQHSNHVAGTIIASGIDKKAKGMAPNAQLIGYDFSNKTPEIVASLNNQEGLISNHSYGYNAGWTYSNGAWAWGGDTNVSSTIDYKFGYYSEYDKELDEILLAAPWHTFVRSAGNHRGENDASSTTLQEADGGATGYDCVAFGSLAKNAIIVGAVQPVLEYTDASSVKMTSFSSWGPTDDGRIVPTIVADGYNVYSSSNGTDTEYATLSGTSMATPSVTGAITLIQEFAKAKTNAYFTSPLIKSLLTNFSKEAGNLGPDYVYGFGLLDAKKVVDAIDSKGKSTDYIEGTLMNGQTLTYTYNTSNSVPFKATVAWLDRAGNPKADVNSSIPKDPSFLNDRTPKLVDDIDMMVTQNSSTYRPYVLDPSNPANVATTGNNIVDNIEQVYVANPENGTVTLTISHKGTLPSEGVKFGLSVGGIAVNKDLEVVSIEPMVMPEDYSVTTPVKATVKNVSTDALDNVDVKFTVTDNITGNIVSTQTKTISHIDPSATSELTIEVNLTSLFNPYTVVAQIMSSDDMNTLNNTKSKTLTGITADLRPTNSSMLENFDDLPTNMHGWKIVNTTGASTWTSTSAAVSYNNTSYIGNITLGIQADDWLITNPILLEGGQSYKVSYYTKKMSASTSRNENLEVSLGNSANISALTNSLNKFTWVQSEANNSWKKVEFTFVAPVSGRQYLGLRHYNNTGTTSYGFYMDNFLIENVGALATNESSIPSDEVKIYPNPAKEKVKIALSGNSSKEINVEILSVEGKLVARTKTSGDYLKNTGLDISELTKGMYFIIINYDGKKYTTKLIKD